ncbi:2-octaprenyl-3-methyl-6-methoxy-1,4-benzoquinol hydroxylase [Escherichia coli HVH 17 (4-7473087)]|nr:2-octaprenyl-3-methyl-6-methoxy-1,4-benzoquinol hydroxylase [Escherichia coli HVH 17 (4-7473087)]
MPESESGALPLGDTPTNWFLNLPNIFDTFRIWWLRRDPVLKRYQMRRMADNFMMQSGMDLFYAGFSNNLPPLRFVRNLGLMAAERAGVLKRKALKYALGL